MIILESTGESDISVSFLINKPSPSVFHMFTLPGLAYATYLFQQLREV